MFTWLFRLGVGAALLSAALWLLRAGMKWWIDGPDREPSMAPWPPFPEVASRPVEQPEEAAPTNHISPHHLNGAWVAPDDAGAALARYPVKAKESSRLYHLPGMLAYDRTRPDRCYMSAEAAEADGFVRAKR
jgi:hypothetical protein